MVDYNQEQTIAIPRSDLLAISILEKRSYMIDAIEDHTKRESTGRQTKEHILKARLLSLFNEIYSMIKRDTDKETIIRYHETIKKGTPEELINLFYEFSDLLDKKGITKIDLRQVYDTLNIEKANKHKGFG